MSNTKNPHQEYVGRKLPHGTAYASHGWARNAAYDADAALRDLRIALAQIRPDKYTRSLAYAPDPQRIEGLIARLHIAREHLTRALTEAGIDVEDFGAEASAAEQAVHDERIAAQDER